METKFNETEFSETATKRAASRSMTTYRRKAGRLAFTGSSSVRRKAGAFAVLTLMCLTVAITTTHRSAVAQPGSETRSDVSSATKPVNENVGTDGNKPLPTTIPETPLEILSALGVFVYPLGLASVIVLWVTIERLVVLRRSRVIPQPFVRRFFDHMREGHLDPKTSLQLCEENGSPIADVFAHGVRKWGKPSVEVEQAIIDGGERQTSQLRKHIRVLNGAATIAPLIGLLGTVAGMISSFNMIAAKQAMGRTEDLAAGIGLALLTTAAGLIIAIPALIMYMYFAGRVDSLIIEMDGLAQDLVDLISAEGLAEQARAAKVAAAAGKSTDLKKPA